MDHVAFGGHQVPLSLPDLIGNMIAPDAQIHRILRNPKVREDHIPVVLVGRWEHEHERRDVGGRREVETAIADPTLQIILIYREGAGVPFLHRHPANSLLDPLVQP